MEWVVDCSFTSALFLPSGQSPAVRSFFSRLSDEDVLRVPSLWWHETANVLAVAQRRKVLSAVDVSGIILLVDGITLSTEEACGTRLLARVSGIAGEHGLSAYDAAYLDLAIRKGGKLATLDRELGIAARAAGVETFPG